MAPTDPTNLPALCNELLAAKQREAKANAERLAIEDRIVALAGAKPEGSKTTKVEGFKITTTGKMSRKMDWTAWSVVRDKIPEEMRPVRNKQELDEKGVKWLQANRADLYKLLPIEVKPAKTSVEIEILPPSEPTT